jgi:hypothetical protein
MTVIILRFFGSAGFSATEGSFFFCKSFISSGPSGLSLLGRDSVITFKISSASVVEGVEGTSLKRPPSAQGWIFSFLLNSHLLLSFWQLVFA